MKLNYSFSILLSLTVLASLGFGASIPKVKLSCRDEKGKPLDWFTLYKLPRTKKNQNKLVNNGTAYIHLSSNLEKWTLSGKSVGEPGSIAGKSLDVLYRTKFDDSSKIGYVIYNDQYEKDDENNTLMANGRRAHAKGVILFNDKTVVWIIHSIPIYPPRPSGGMYYLAESQSKYGQSMMCLTLPIASLSQIGKQLMFAYPQVVDSFIPSSLLKKNKDYIDNLQQVIDGKRVKEGPWHNVEPLTTVGKHKFLAMHKHTKFNSDLYSGLVAPTLNSSIFTETWSNGAGTMETDCKNKHAVYNIEQLNVKLADLSFTVNNDHSKWAINNPQKNDKKSVCIGDINRQISQLKRGGGIVCFLDNPNVWKSYFDLIDTTENCKNENVAPQTL